MKKKIGKGSQKIFLKIKKKCEDCGEFFEFNFKGEGRNSLPDIFQMTRNTYCRKCRKKHANKKNTTKN